MTKPELFKQASGGNQDAFKFLCAAYEHFEAIRQFITSGSTDSHQFIGLMAKTNQAFSLPFYVQHGGELHISVLRVVNGLQNEVSMSLVADVAFITLGFEGARKLLVEVSQKE